MQNLEYVKTQINKKGAAYYERLLALWVVRDCETDDCRTATQVAKIQISV